MNQMREQFEEHAYCWAASFTRSGEEYCDDEVNSAWLYFKAGAAWQAAQSAAVPVCDGNYADGAVMLHLKPPHSISADELERLQRNDARYLWMRNHTSFNYSVHKAAEVGGIELDQAIDAAIAGEKDNG